MFTWRSSLKKWNEINVLTQIQLPFAAAHQLSVKLLVTFRSYDGILEFFGLDEVIFFVSLQVVRLGDVAGHWGQLLVDALRLVLLQVCICWGCRQENRNTRTQWIKSQKFWTSYSADDESFRPYNLFSSATMWTNLPSFAPLNRILVHVMNAAACRGH